MSQQEKMLELASAYGDGWYDGYLTAVKDARKDSIDDVTEEDVIRWSEVAESESSWGAKFQALENQCN